jgi:hypothetical protein
MTEAVPLKDAPAGQGGASFAEIAARRRGRLRRYLHQHPRVMDAVVVLCYLLLVTPTMVDAVRAGVWLAAGLLTAVALSLFLRRRYPVPLVAFIAAVEVAVTVLHPWGTNVSAGLWFSLYALAVVRTGGSPWLRLRSRRHRWRCSTSSRLWVRWRGNCPPLQRRPKSSS